MISKNDAQIVAVQKKIERFTADEIAFIISCYQDILADQLLKRKKTYIHGVGSLSVKTYKPRSINTSKLGIGKDAVLSEPRVFGELKVSDEIKVILREEYIRNGVKQEGETNG